MKKSTYCWMGTALLSGMLVYPATVAMKNPSWRAYWKLSPVIEYPPKLDLGEHEKGDVVTVPFTIANRGGGALLIDEIASNCGCTGMEREENGRYIRLQSLRLKSGEEVQLVMRVSVGGPLGLPSQNVVAFRTNDPGQPEAQIEVLVTRVSGGILTAPESVVFGTVPVGGNIHQLVDIRDSKSPPRSIKRVTSSGSDQITVRLLSDTELSKRKDTETNGALVGRLEVTLSANRPSNINAAVDIEVEGREDKPDKLPVVGKVAALFEMRPSLIVLPRSTSNGLVYSATCHCRGITGKPVTLTVDSLPSGLTAQVLSEVSAGERAVQIVYDPRAGKEQPRGQRRTIRFRAKDGENEAVLDLPIILQQ